MATVITPTEMPSEPDAAEARTFPPHLLTVDRYVRMVEAGIFSEKEPIFLWHGRLVEKMTKGCPHAFAVSSLMECFIGLVPVGWHVRQEQPVLISDRSMPEPDLSVIRGARRDYLSRHPTPGDASLLIEVAASSLPIDSGDVLETYAAEGIPIYWIVNIPGRRVEVYTDPDGPSYRVRRDYGPGDEVPIVLDGREIGRAAVDAILP